MGFELAYASEFADVVARIDACGSIEAWVEQFEAKEKFGGADFAVVSAVAMSACYSPDPDSPFGFAFPFDLETGAMLPDRWHRWRENDPISMVQSRKAADALRALDLLHLECGTRDEVRLHLGLRLFRKGLDALGIPHEAEEFPDTHRSLRYRYDVSIPKLARALHGNSRPTGAPRP